MTTLRIEEMVDEFERQMPLMRAHGKLLCATASPTTYKKIKDWLRKALTKAHQAGIDEVVEIMEDNKIVEQDGHPFCFKEKECEYNQALNDTIKALQDHK